MALFERFRKGWNAFSAEEKAMSDEVVPAGMGEIGISSSHRQDRVRFFRFNDKTILESIITRIAIDVASSDLKHVRLGENNQFLEEIDSGLNRCLNEAANIDQTARPYKQDMAQSLCEIGTIAIVAVDTTEDPDDTEAFDVMTMRVGEVTRWFPRHVTINLYNDRTGRFQEITRHKSTVAVVENPLFPIMNAQNSTLQRLQRKLQMLDTVDEQVSSGKLDLIFQLPYTIKSDSRRKQAKERRQDIEDQLRDGKYGIAYVDATERITQLNRPAENNLLKQIEYLTNQLYAQLGLTPAVFDGTADEQQMLNYHNRTVEPILAAIQEGIHRVFLSKTARSQSQAVRYYRDPFKYVPVANMAEIADKFTRNEILTSNEIRSIIGFRPSTDKKADELRNSNLNHPDEKPIEAGEIPNNTSQKALETSKEEKVT